MVSEKQSMEESTGEIERRIEERDDERKEDMIAKRRKKE
jgi:hypothetical protein